MKKLTVVLILLLFALPSMAADYYILKKSVDNWSAVVVVHLPIPATQTTAGTALSDATLTYQRAVSESIETDPDSTNDTDSVVPGITAVDKAVTDFAMTSGGTTITSASGGFVSGMIGSRLNIATGTNFVAGNYKVTGFNSATSLELDADATNGSNASSGTGTIIARQTMLDNGELYEKRLTFDFDTLSLTNIQRRTQIEGGSENGEIGVSQMLVDIATPGSDLWNEILEPLEWWGYWRVIP